MGTLVEYRVSDSYILYTRFLEKNVDTLD